MLEARAHLFFDTVSISNFALACRLDLIAARYAGRAHLTTEVLDEIAEGVAHGYSALLQVEPLIQAGALQATVLSAAERALYGRLLPGLGPGEASAVACARLRAGIAVTDDRAARACCAEHEVAFTGTIGILEAMVRHGFYSPVRRISDLL
ncbi:MAG: hypothetical protein AB1505_19775 [Candidatus Latescibacterota bacterium]